MIRGARLAVLAVFLAAAPAAALPSSSEVAVEFPLEGGAMLMAAHDWRVSKYIRLDVIAGGGVIEREPEIRLPDGQEAEAEISSAVFPFIGPRVTFATPVVGLSLGFAAFRAKAETRIDWPGRGTLEGTVTDWGTGFHAPFLELDFADKKRDVVYGFGLGGFFSASFDDLKAEGAPGAVTVDTSPINTLTARVKIVWGFGRVRKAEQEDEDF